MKITFAKVRLIDETLTGVVHLEQIIVQMQIFRLSTAPWKVLQCSHLTVSRCFARGIDSIVKATRCLVDLDSLLDQHQSSRLYSLIHRGIIPLLITKKSPVI